MKGEKFGGGENEAPQKSPEELRQEKMAKIRAELPIGSTYKPSDEKLNPIKDEISAQESGEHSMLYSNKEGKLGLISDYQDVLEANEQTNSEALKDRPDIKKVLDDFVLQLSLVDASNGKILDGSEKSRQFCDSLDKINSFTKDDERAKNAITAALGAVYNMGNALKLMKSNYDVLNEAPAEDSNENETPESEQQTSQESVEQTRENMKALTGNIEALFKKVGSFDNAFLESYSTAKKELEEDIIDPNIVQQMIKEMAENYKAETQIITELSKAVSDARDMINNQDALSQKEREDYDNIIKNFEDTINRAGPLIEGNNRFLNTIKNKFEQLGYVLEADEEEPEPEEDASNEAEDAAKEEEKREQAKKITAAIEGAHQDIMKAVKNYEYLQERYNYYRNQANAILDYGGDLDDARQFIRRAAEHNDELAAVVGGMENNTNEMFHALKSGEGVLDSHKADAYNEAIRKTADVVEGLKEQGRQRNGQVEDMEQSLRRLRYRSEY